MGGGDARWQVPRQGAGLHVVVADDSVSTRKFLKAQLERNGYLVHVEDRVLANMWFMCLFFS
jgi:hypothetical protein